MKNCNVSHSKSSGLRVDCGGLMMIDGNGTTIHHNCTGGDTYHYGLETSSSSSIHLASSLTIESISKNNGGGGNLGGANVTTTTQKYWYWRQISEKCHWRKLGYKSQEEQKDMGTQIYNLEMGYLGDY